MLLGKNTLVKYLKCKDDHSGVKFQVKVLFYNSAVYFEFSCGCCMLADASTSTLLAPADFACLFINGLRKLFATRFVQKNLSLWNSAGFEKTRHFFCPKDPQLFSMLIEMLDEVHNEIPYNVKAYMAEMVKSKEFLQRLENDPNFDLSYIARRYLMPVFNNPSTMPDTHSVPRMRKDRKLPKQAKEALQVKSSEISVEEEALTDQQLVELFDENSEQKERKQKLSKKKPNKGKAPNAIRKTQKPARL
jgi:hypothetical protein